MSQQTLVDKLADLGVTTWHQTTVGKVESGTRPVRLAEALAVSEIFGLSIDEFLSRTPTASEDRAYRARLFTARRAELGVLQSLIEARERQLDMWIDTLIADQDLPADMPTLPTYHLEPEAGPADEPAERDVGGADDTDAAST